MLTDNASDDCDALHREPSTISRIVPYWARRCPDRIAIVEGARDYSFGMLDRSIRETARMLERMGIGAGDRVMLVCENCCAAVVTYFSILAIGAWPVLINARLSDREIDEVRDHCQARLAIYTIGASRSARSHSARHGGIAAGSVALGEISLGPWNEDAQPEPSDAQEAARVAALIYTTGTTGRAKGVMLTHGNLLFVARESARIRCLGPEDRVYAVLPVSHVLGLTGVLIASLLSGAQIHLPSRFDPAATLRAIANLRISVMIGTPPMYAMLAEYAARNGLTPVTGSDLRLISSAGAPLDAATKACAEKTFGRTLHNGYGITETSPTLTLTRLDEPRTDCSVGRLLPGIEARLRGPDGEAPAAGEAGELFVRGPGVMKGYYRSPEETSQAVDSEGWFRTGDLARVENENFFIVGRSKELIIRFGFNVHPAEIESVLNAHPQVARSAVVGRQAEGGEEVVAFVQLKQGCAATSAEIAEFASRQLTPYKRPSKIVMVESMPASPTGKIIKSALSAMA